MISIVFLLDKYPKATINVPIFHQKMTDLLCKISERKHSQFFINPTMFQNHYLFYGISSACSGKSGEVSSLLICTGFDFQQQLLFIRLIFGNSGIKQFVPWNLKKIN